MKNMIRLMTATACLFTMCTLSNAQENYTIKMQMKIDGLPAEYAAMGEQEIVTYIKDQHQKTEMTGMMGSAIVYYDGKKMTSLTDQMGQKRGFTATKEELEADDKTKSAAKPKVEYSDEKKSIAGYDCRKATITTTDKDKAATKTIVWYTDKIKVDPSHQGKTGRGMVDLGDLKGYPLSMEMSQNAGGTEMKSTITATEVLTTPIDESVFQVNTAGYTMMPYKEMKEMQKAAMMGK